MTDERMHDVVASVERLPRGSGIVFRHHATPLGARRSLFRRIRRVARARRHCLLLAAAPGRALSWGADGAHHASYQRSRGVRSVAVHSPRERIVAMRTGATLIFVSPVFATRSHPGQRPLGRRRALTIAGPMRRRTMLLGGMTALRWRSLRTLGFHGWAAIDAFA